MASCVMGSQDTVHFLTPRQGVVPPALFSVLLDSILDVLDAFSGQSL